MSRTFGDTNAGRSASAERFQRRMHQQRIGIDEALRFEFHQVRLQHHIAAANVHVLVVEDVAVRWRRRAGRRPARAQSKRARGSAAAARARSPPGPRRRCRAEAASISRLVIWSAFIPTTRPALSAPRGPASPAKFRAASGTPHPRGGNSPAGIPPCAIRPSPNQLIASAEREAARNRRATSTPALTSGHVHSVQRRQRHARGLRIGTRFISQRLHGAVIPAASFAGARQQKMPAFRNPPGDFGRRPSAAFLLQRQDRQRVGPTQAAAPCVHGHPANSWSAGRPIPKSHCAQTVQIRRFVAGRASSHRMAPSSCSFVAKFVPAAPVPPARSPTCFPPHRPAARNRRPAGPPVATSRCRARHDRPLLLPASPEWHTPSAPSTRLRGHTANHHPDSACRLDISTGHEKGNRNKPEKTRPAAGKPPGSAGRAGRLNTSYRKIRRLAPAG